MEKEPKTSLEKTGIDCYKGSLYLWMPCFLVSLWSNASREKDSSAERRLGGRRARSEAVGVLLRIQLYSICLPLSLPISSVSSQFKEHPIILFQEHWALKSRTRVSKY